MNKRMDGWMRGKKMKFQTYRVTVEMKRKKKEGFKNETNNYHNVGM